jgi:4-amino-4-deoxy-L-arabinose transferase
VTSYASKKYVGLYFLLAFYLLIYIVPLGLRPLIIPDETRYAEISREMIQTNNWIVPQLNALRYFEKPPLAYWLNSISMKAFGENAFAIRFPSALSAGLSTCLIGLFLLRAGYRPALVVSAAVIYLSLFETLFISTSAILDSVFSLFLTAGIVFFYLGSSTSSPGINRRWFAGSGAMIGLAFLAKGFLAFVVPGIILLPWLVLEKRFEILRYSGWILGACFLVMLPWALLIHYQEPDYWHYFIWEQHINRFMGGHAQHAAPAYYFLMLLPILAIPWTAMLPAVIKGIRINLPQKSVLSLLLLWFFMPLIFFSISKGKLPTYILPCMAPFSIMLAIGITEYLKKGAIGLFRVGVVVNALSLLTLFSVFLYFGFFTENRHVAFYPETETELLILFLILIFMAVLPTFFLSLTDNIQFKIMLVALPVLPIYLAFNSSLPTHVILNKSPVALFSQFESKLALDDVAIADGDILPSVNWSLKRDDLYAFDTRGELAYGLGYPEAAHRYLDEPGFVAKLNEAKMAGRNVAVFCDENCPERYLAYIPPAAEHYSDGNFTVHLIINRQHHD